MIARRQFAARRIREDPALEGMGCTLVGVAITAAGAEWISVGDSPLGLARDCHLIRLNADHSMAPVIAAQVRRGELSPYLAARHPSRHMLRSVVTGEEIPLVDRSAAPVPLQPGDRLIVASDGLLTLSEEEIAAIVATGADAEPVAEELIRAVAARDDPHQDNATVLVAVPYLMDSRE